MNSPPFGAQSGLPRGDFLDEREWRAWVKKLMSVASQSVLKAENRFSPLAICGMVLILLLAGLLRGVGVSLVIPALAAGAVALLWVAFRHPTGGLGSLLAFTAIFPLTFLIAKFFGPPYIAQMEGCDRAALVVIACILLKRNGVKLVAVDWFLLATFGLAVIRLGFGGEIINLLADFSFVIAYAVGRVTSLNADRQKLWASRAVWIVATLSLLGMIEVFVLGQGPRAILYSQTQRSFAPDGTLVDTFSPDSLFFKEASTMILPMFFGLLCMVALIIWWAYCRNPLPAALIAAGLICSITRSAWISTALAIPLLAFRMEQGRRFARYSLFAVALFIASIPFLGLTDYLAKTKSGEENSAQGHVISLADGLQYVISHPFGAGPGNYEHPPGAKHDATTTSGAPWIENSYLMIFAEYGTLSGLCFVGFVLFALRTIWPQRTPLGYVAFGILIGFGMAMMFAPVHGEFSLASWVWFPVGLAVRSSTAPAVS